MKSGHGLEIRSIISLRGAGGHSPDADPTRLKVIRLPSTRRFHPSSFILPFLSFFLPPFWMQQPSVRSFTLLQPLRPGG
jgi:hypothetical protein